jgi:TP901 family phage tail tape measure protein
MPSNPLSEQSDDVTVAIGGDASGATGAIDSVIGGLNDMKLAAGAAGGVIAGLGTKLAVDAVNAAATFEDKILDLQKVAGEDVAAGLEDDIQQMAEQIPLTAEELAGLATEAARFGVEGEENIRRFVESAAKMSSATTLSVNESSEAFAKLSELTNTPIEDVENLGSSINTLSNNFATSSQEIVDASLRSAGALSGLGLKQTEIFGLSASLNEVSESSERAGSRLRRLAQEMQDADPETFAEPLGLTTEEFETMRDEKPAELMQLLAETFAEGGDAADNLRDELSTTSRQAVSGLSQNLDGLSNAMETSNDSFEEGSSIQSEFKQETAKTTTQQELLSSKINNVKRDLGEDLLPAFNSVIDVVAGAVDRFSDLNDKTDGMLAKWGLIGGTLAGAVTAIGAVVSVLGGLSAIAGTVTAGVGALGTALTVLTGPIGIVVAAIAALAVAWQQNWGDIQGKTEAVVETLQSVIKTGLSAIQQFWVTHGDKIVSTVKSAYNTVKSIISGTVNALWTNITKPVLQTIREAWKKNGEDILSDVKQIFNTIKSTVSNVVRALWNNITKPALDLIRKGWKKWGDDIQRLLKGIFDGIETAVSTFITTIVEAFDLVTDLLTGDWKGAWQSAKKIVSTSVDGLKSVIDGATDPIADAIGRVVEEITSAFDPVVSSIKEKLSYLIGTGEGTLIGDISDALSNVTETAKSAFDYLTGTGDGTLIGDLTDAFGSIGSAMTDPIKETWNEAIGGFGIDIDGFELSPPDWVPTNASFEWGGFSATIPKMDTGGLIEETGLFVGHAGERVVPEAQVSDRGPAPIETSDSGMTVHIERIEASGRREGREAGEALKRELKRFDI